DRHRAQAPAGRRAEGLQLGSGCGRLHGEARLPPARAPDLLQARAQRGLGLVGSVEALALHALGGELLIGEMARAVVWIVVADAAAQAGRSVVAGALQVGRRGLGAVLAHVL